VFVHLPVGAYRHRPALPPFPTRRSSDLRKSCPAIPCSRAADATRAKSMPRPSSLTTICIRPPSLKAANLNLPMTFLPAAVRSSRSEEHTYELQSLAYLVCRLLLEKKKSL